jgi:RNA polymerase sigma-70 factor (ECF subfamily)
MTTTRRDAMPARARTSVQRCSRDADLTARFVHDVAPLRERLCRHAFGLTRNYSEAEDLVQETMMKAYSAFHSFRPGTNLKAWLLRIMINSHINDHRKAQHRPVLDCIGELNDQQLAQARARRTEAGPDSAEERWLDALTNHDITAAMRALPEQFREVVYYRDVVGLSYREIAALMNIPYGTAVSRLNRSHQRLRQLLAHPTCQPSPDAAARYSATSAGCALPRPTSVR